MRKIIFLLIAVLTPLLLNARTPEWVSSMPQNSLYFWGIGVCDLSNPNYKEVAEKDALEQIVQQISVKVESKSFLSMEETDYEVHESYKQKMQASSQVYLENLQIFDTYQDKKTYYVCYRLSKDEYNAKVRAKSQEVAKNGYDFLLQARNAEADGNLTSALLFYQKGLETVEQWLFLELIYMNENVPVALYAGYTSLWDGLTLQLQPQSASVQNFSAINIEIIALLLKGNTPIRNVPLVAKFVDGAGKVSPSAKTDNSGEAHFRVTQLSGKEATQVVKISVDKSMIKELPAVFQKKNAVYHFPEAQFHLDVEQQQWAFYIYTEEDVLPTLTRQISSVLSNDNFDITTDYYEATHIVEIVTDLRLLGTVPGDLENLDEWLATLNIRVMDKNGAVLTQYADEARVLTPENTTRTGASQQASKELLKRFKRDFPKKLEKIAIR